MPKTEPLCTRPTMPKNAAAGCRLTAVVARPAKILYSDLFSAVHDTYPLQDTFETGTSGLDGNISAQSTQTWTAAKQRQQQQIIICSSNSSNALATAAAAITEKHRRQQLQQEQQQQKQLLQNMRISLHRKNIRRTSTKSETIAVVPEIQQQQ
ncbi:hypothetical protein PoB_003344500 [Plakobranchus ocellatus]|uniref:Uncharacterized protein n=1 Tax=Plakobranchus ocellatus TaxID=259542 RepID=A0AAV4AFK0_9GAST|nr:hypothetical protein PoB_003344500 [Plakobranchus ocellatus]